MKKILFTVLFVTFVMPVFAACSLDGSSCSTLSAPSLQERYAPNNLNNLQKPDAFSPSYFKPYQDMLINTETNAPTGAASSQNYNSNCQFGICLPENQEGTMPKF